MTDALKPCPFCGGEGHIDGTSWTTRDGKEQAWVTCKSCGTYGPSSTDAIAAWNRRPKAAALDREAALKAEVERLREVEAWQIRGRAQHFLRRTLNAPEDPHVEVLCERYGYGAVMDAASRLWARKDGLGAFYVGGCIGMKTDEQARAALAGKGGAA